MGSYYNNGPRAHTPSHIASGIGKSSIFRAADCIQRAVAQEEHPPVNTSHNARMKNLQHTHPYTFAALRRTESQKAEMEATVTQRKLAEALNPPTGHTR